MLLSVGEGEAPFCINNFVLNYFKLDIMSLIMQQQQAQEEVTGGEGGRVYRR